VVPRPAVRPLCRGAPAGSPRQPARRHAAAFGRLTSAKRKRGTLLAHTNPKRQRGMRFARPLGGKKSSKKSPTYGIFPSGFLSDLQLILRGDIDALCHRATYALVARSRGP